MIRSRKDTSIPRSARSARWLVAGALGGLLVVATACGSSGASNPGSNTPSKSGATTPVHKTSATPATKTTSSPPTNKAASAGGYGY